MKIKTQIHIEASPEQVWQVLTDFDTYAAWNPFIVSIAGDVALGNMIDVKVQGMRFKPKVLQFETNKAFVWKGKLFIKGLFDGTHSFKLQDNGDGSTTFLHGENFSGILVPLFKKMLNEKTEPGFVAMNEALKRRVEELVLASD